MLFEMKLPTPATLAMISTASSTFQLNSKESRSPVRKFGNIDGRMIFEKVSSRPALKTEATWK